MRLLEKWRNWRRYFYLVPWCVPPWGWPELRATCRSIATGKIVSGEAVDAAVNAIREYSGVPYVVPFNRGRTAIEVGLRAMGISAGDDVVVPAYVCETVLEGVLRAGATPVFADVGPDLNVTVATVQAAITPKTKCLIVPHLFGVPAHIPEIEKMVQGTGIKLMDDAAQAFGTKLAERPLGTFGDCGIISCGPGKPLVGAAGGFLLTSDEQLYHHAMAVPLPRERRATVARRILRFWIERRLRKFSLPFLLLFPKRWQLEEESHAAATLSNVDAAIMLEQLQSLEQRLVQRRENASSLMRQLADIPGTWIQVLGERDATVKLVVVLPATGPSTNNMLALLAERGVECQAGYVPLHLKTLQRSTRVPYTDSVWARVFCIPVEITPHGLRR